MNWYKLVPALLFSLIACISFITPSLPYNKTVSDYYDTQLDSLSIALNTFQKAVDNKKDNNSIKQHFLHCRCIYKRIEFFIDQFDIYTARQINGIDLVQAEEDNPDDLIQPHGFQHIETNLYGASVNHKELKTEIALLNKNVNKLRNDPDRIYYFKNEKIWETIRSGAYRIVSLGITGFDVPLCLNALPETKNELTSLKNITAAYKNEINQKDPELYNNTIAAFDKALAFLKTGKGFNSFNRVVFIREYMNPLSTCLMKCNKLLGYFNYQQLTPLNPEAAHLFAANVFNPSYFSPNPRYRATPDRISLGKELFYDNRLSINNKRSCASCHKPEKAFTDGLIKASNIDSTHLLLRNTPTLWNVVFQTKQFFDSRTGSLENQLRAVVHNTEEMGGSLHNAIPALYDDEHYAMCFKKAYPDDKETITEFTIANAVSSYVRSLVSFNSRFDKYIRHESDSFSAHEKNGFNLFMGKAKCGTCHYAPIFNGIIPPQYQETESEILGVPAENVAKAKLDEDEGKYRFTKISLHKYAFKIPTVRNSALTAPYMHNGVFKTLNEVIDFYNKGGGAGIGIKLKGQTLPIDKLHLTKPEINDIVAFLTSLNDTTATN